MDDGSTDQSVQIVKNFLGTGIRLISQSNQGVAAARNCGISEANEEWIAFLDADDEWRENYIQTIDNLRCEFPSCNVLATSYEIGDPTGKFRTPRLNGLPTSTWKGILPNYFRLMTRSDPPFFSSSVVVRRNALCEIGGFKQGVRAGEDLLCWAKLAMRNQIAYTSTPYSIYWHPGPGKRPIRTDPKEDYVAKELLEEFRNQKQIKSEHRHFLAHWHKIRASTYLEHRRRSLAIGQIFRAIRWNPCNVRLWIYLGLSISPPIILDSAVRQILRRRRG